MESRADDLSGDEGLPQPGTEEGGEAAERADPTEGPGNVSVDEPTQPPLGPDEGDGR
jgi:hypothetical protein